MNTLLILLVIIISLIFRYLVNKSLESSTNNETTPFTPNQQEIRGMLYKLSQKFHLSLKDQKEAYPLLSGVYEKIPIKIQIVTQKSIELIKISLNHPQRLPYDLTINNQKKKEHSFFLGESELDNKLNIRGFQNDLMFPLINITVRKILKRLLTIPVDSKTLILTIEPFQSTLAFNNFTILSIDFFSQEIHNLVKLYSQLIRKHDRKKELQLLLSKGKEETPLLAFKYLGPLLSQKERQLLCSDYKNDEKEIGLYAAYFLGNRKKLIDMAENNREQKLKSLSVLLLLKLEKKVSLEGEDLYSRLPIKEQSHLINEMTIDGDFELEEFILKQMEKHTYLLLPSIAYLTKWGTLKAIETLLKVKKHNKEIRGKSATAITLIQARFPQNKEHGQLSITKSQTGDLSITKQDGELGFPEKR